MFSATLGLLARDGADGPRFIFPLLLLLLIGGLTFWLIRRRRGGDAADRASALGTLQDRFARGDIDRAVFEHRQAVLTGADVVPPAPHRSAADRPAPPAPPTQSTAASSTSATTTQTAPEPTDGEPEAPGADAADGADTGDEQ